MSIHPLHPLLHLLVPAACLLGGGALAQGATTPIDVQQPYNAWRPFTFSATDTSLGWPHATTFAVASQPAHGQLGVFFLGSVNYFPDAGYVGEDSFAYTVSTANGTSALATVRITMQPPVPSCHDVPFNTRKDLFLTGYNPNWGTDLRVFYEPVSRPAHATVVDSFAFTAMSANGTSAPATVSVLVGQPIVLGTGAQPFRLTRFSAPTNTSSCSPCHAGRAEPPILSL